MNKTMGRKIGFGALDWSARSIFEGAVALYMLWGSAIVVVSGAGGVGYLCWRAITGTLVGGGELPIYGAIFFSLVVIAFVSWMLWRGFIGFLERRPISMAILTLVAALVTWSYFHNSDQTQGIVSAIFSVAMFGSTLAAVLERYRKSRTD